MQNVAKYVAKHLGLTSILRTRYSATPLTIWCGRPDLNRHGKLLPRDF